MSRTPAQRDAPLPAGAARAAAGGLVARTVPVAGSPDLLAIGGRPGGVLWQRHDDGLAGFGTAMRIALPAGAGPAGDPAAVAEVLAAMRVEDEVGEAGCGPVAIGALPFDPSAPASVVVPRWVVGQRDGTAWVTSIAPSGDGARIDGPGTGGDPLGAVRALEAGGPVGDPPDEFTLTSTLPHSRWRELVGDAVAEIKSGGLAKVVLSRKVDVRANRPFVVPDVLERLRALYPACMVFHVDGFLGASPELLIERRGGTVRSHPLAGTVARSGDVAADQRLVADLVASAKDRREHRFVIDELVRALAPLCDELHVPDRPEVLALRNVSHLATSLAGRLRADPARPGAWPSALELVGLVHPTPAVAGTPTEAAVAYLQQVEGYDRGPYAGPVGWMDHRGDGAWALGIRSAQVAGGHASMFAGVGLVAGSDPEAELGETQLKLQALLAALVRP